jgi:hypothetical protein
VETRAAVSLYAAVNANCAPSAVASPACTTPPTMPGGNPTTEVLGLTPRSPLNTVVPLLVTPVPPSTEKVAADPSEGPPAEVSTSAVFALTAMVWLVT